MRRRKLPAVLAAVLLAAGPVARAASEEYSEEGRAFQVTESTSPGDLEPFVITAPRMPESEIRALKRARGAGTGTALAGTGLMTYAVFFAAAGPVGWAAALIAVGATGAYLSHRRLDGKDDFGPQNEDPAALE